MHKGNEGSYPTSLSALVVLVRFRVLSATDRKYVWLVFLPFILGLSRTIGIKASCRSKKLLNLLRISSLALRRHLSVFPLRLLSSYPCPTSTVDHARETPHISFFALQHFRIKEPFCSLFFWKSVLKILPHLQKVPPAGFGYPLGEYRSLILEGLFQPPTLMGFALQSFALSR